MVRTSGQEKERARRRQPQEESDRKPLNDETRHGIFAVVLFVIAGLSLLGFFDLAGPLGREIDRLEGVFLGWIRYFVPVILVVIGAVLLRSPTLIWRGLTALGLILLVISLTGLAHLFFDVNESFLEATRGHGGGYIGYGTAWPLLKVAGRVAGFIILFALLIISFLILFNLPLQKMTQGGMSVGRFPDRFRSLLARRAGREEDQEEERGHGSTDREESEPEQATLLDRPETDVRLSTYDLPDVRKRRKVKTDIPLDLLEKVSMKPTTGDVRAISDLIKKTLENFGINVEMGEVNVGPTVTQYTLKPVEGVKLSQIVTLANDLALALAAHPIRIEAPIPGKSLVGIEVPNKTTAIVSLKEILSSEEFRRKKSNLTVGLGKDVSGQPLVARLDTMPHLLIAGATGSGKSVCINSIIVSLLYQNQPSDLKFILVDPKRVELISFNDIPHLITPVITEVPKTVNSLRWAVAEMDRRYQLLSNSGARNIASYNAKSTANGSEGLTDVERLPYIVIVIDELADLMATAANEVEGAIVRLAQMARGVGIHLVVATQRPSVDVITGLIKANITSRIAFSVASVVDSRTILDSSGAEKLLGRGDLLYLSAELTKPKRLQGAYVSDDEIRRVVEHLRQQAEPMYEESVVNVAPATEKQPLSEDDEDELYEEAKQIIIQAGKASASLLQRRLRVGYARAARLLDILEDRGVIGPLDGARPRKLLTDDDRGTMNIDDDQAIDDEPMKPVS